MRIERIVQGRRLGAADVRRLTGGVLTRDLVVDGARWPKGRRLTSDEVVRLTLDAVDAPHSRPVTLLMLEPGDMHEDEAAVRLAAAVAGDGVTARAPAQSRVDLVAAHDGVLRIRTATLERVDRIDPLGVFTRLDGQVVSAGDVVAGVKVAPHVVAEASIALAEQVIGGRGIVRVLPYAHRIVGVLVKEAIHAPARARFEASARQKVEALGSAMGPIAYVADVEDVVRETLGSLTSGPDRVDLVLTAGSSSTDPGDAFFLAISALGGRLVRRGVPAHPGSMLWLGRVGRTTILGLPTCGAYSRATAADLLIPWLLSGAPPTRATIARLGHGGLLTHDQRARFPAYARDLEAPEG